MGGWVLGNRYPIAKAIQEKMGDGYTVTHTMGIPLSVKTSINGVSVSGFLRLGQITATNGFSAVGGG